jgi:Na+-driven multidrug efflux pump
VKKTLKLAIVAATLVVTGGFILIQLFPTQLLGAFTSDKELISIGVHGMKLYLIVLPVVGFQIVSANFFQAIGKAGKSMLLSMLRQVIILIPLLIILPRIFHLEGVWYAGPISDFTSSLVTAVFLLAEMRLLERKHAESLARG